MALMTQKRLATMATSCQDLARGLAHWQNEPETKLKPGHVEKLVNALLNAGNSVEFLLREGRITLDEETPCQTSEDPPTSPSPAS